MKRSASDLDDDDIDEALLSLPDEKLDGKSLLCRFGHIFTEEDLKHCVYDEERQFFEFFVDQRSAAWHGLRSKISSRYPSTVKRMTGSILSAIVGLSRKTVQPHDLWRAWTGQLREGESDEVKSNVDMQYGVMYEPRIRRILARLLNMPIKEPGFYVDAIRPHFGVSPDGITPPVSLVVSFGDAALPASLKVGRTIIEIKASMRLLRAVPQIEHLVQMHEEMFIPRVQWGWLAYWHCDAVRIWLVKFQPSFWDWIMRRAEGFLEACLPGNTLSEELETSMGFGVQDVWFGEEEARLAGRKFYPHNWDRRWWPPEKPECWLVYEHTEVGSRDPEREAAMEFEGSNKLYPRLRDDDDPWFDSAWKTLPEEQKAMSTATPQARIFHIEADDHDVPVRMPSIPR